MALTGTVTLAVLMGALLHAAWNALVKSSTDKALDTALIHLIGSLVAIPGVVLLGWPPAEAWPYILTSMLIHIGYYVALAGAYQHGDLGLTYPLMRGTAPMLVALASILGLGEVLSPMAWAGVLGVSAGVLMLGLSRHALDSPRAVAFALANACIIATYTIVDAYGVRASGHALQYVFAIFVLDGWPYGLAVLARRGRSAWPYAVQRWPLALCGALGSLGAYGVTLWAMTRAPVAMVAALRETSVLFAAFLGTWVLKERFTLRRAIGTLVIVVGVMALRLG